MNLKQIIIAVLALLIGMAIFFFGQSQYQKGYAQHEKETAAAVIELNAEYRAKEEVSLSILRQKQRDLEDEKEKSHLAITGLRNQLERLQHAITQRQRTVPQATETASAFNEDTTIAWALFSQCTANYGELAQSTDGLLIDLKEWQAYGATIESF